jgi:hypothetical protein
VRISVLPVNLPRVQPAPDKAALWKGRALSASDSAVITSQNGP